MDKTQEEKNKILKPCLITGISCSLLSLGVGFLIGFGVFNPSKDERKILDEYKLLKDEWLYGNEDAHLLDLISKGIVNSVADEKGDPYTFYTENEEEQNLSISGYGFGFSTHYYDGGLYITHLEKGSALEAGLKKGDVLYSVTLSNINLVNNHFDFKQHSYSEINEFINKDYGENVVYSFEYKRNEELKTVNLKKGSYEENIVEVIQSPNEDNGNKLVLKINSFLGNLTFQVRQILNQYKSSQNQITLILDLRGNGGGYVSEAQNMSKLFVKKGTLIDRLVDKKAKTKSETYQYKDPEFNFKEYRLILDSLSASATECFALNMRTLSNKDIYGFKSYGKGIAQNFKTFSDGSVVRYTSSYVYGPKRLSDEYTYQNCTNDALCINKEGIYPDIEYNYDYQYLAKGYDISTSLGISEKAQQFYLKCFKDMYGSEYPNVINYSQDFHFADLLEILKQEFGIADLYQENGYFNKDISDKFIKTTFDKYLIEEDKLLAYVVSL